MITSIR